MFGEGGIHAADDDAPPSVPGVFEAVMHVVVPSRNGVALAVTRLTCEQERDEGQRKKDQAGGDISGVLCLSMSKLQVEPQERICTHEPSRALSLWYPIPEDFGVTG